MSTLIGTFTTRNVVYLESFASSFRAQGSQVLYYAQFPDLPRPQRREALGILTVGFCLGPSSSTTVPLRLHEEFVPYGGALGLLFFPWNLEGWYTLMFQPFESLIGQTFAFIIEPD